MILYYDTPLLRRQSVKIFTEVYMLVYVCAHIYLTIFFIYWSDTSLGNLLSLVIL